MACLIRLDNGQIFNITTKIDIIGRGSNASIFLDDEGISRNHAEVFMMSGCVEIIDLNSRNGILVNGTKTHKSFLNSGDKVSIGSVDLVFSHETVDENQTVNIFDQAKSQQNVMSDSSASGRMELLQIRPEDSFLKAGGASLNNRYLEQLFESSLKFNIVGGTDRFLNVVYDFINVNLAPSIFLVRLGNDYIIENPFGSKSGIAKQIFNHTLKQGVSFLRRKKTAQSPGSAMISCPVLDADREVIGGVYLEVRNKNFEIEDLLFVRALVAQATGVHTISPTESSHEKIKFSFDPGELLIHGNSNAVLLLKKRIGELCQESEILVSGPPGTERQVIAKNIHSMSRHSDRPFVYVNCAELDQSLLHQTLFGRSGQNLGKFGDARDGTLMLDSISSLPLEIQESIRLYTLTSNILPLGNSEAEQIKVQLIIGVCGRPDIKCARNLLSQKLLVEFDGKRLHIPDLKERPKDITVLIDFYMGKFMQKYNKGYLTIAQESRELLCQHSWSGNEREIEIEIERAVLCCSEETLTPAYFTLT